MQRGGGYNGRDEREGCEMKALAFGGPGQRTCETADDPGIEDPARCRGRDSHDDDL
jgi:hypothetical protein